MYNKFKSELLTSLSELLTNRTIDQDFEIMTLAMKAMTKYLLELKENENEIVRFSIEQYEESTKNLNSNQYENILFERLYINNYFYFEEYISKCLVLLYTNFPKFLLTEEISVDYEDLFEQDSVVYIRSRIIEKKVKSIIQSSNIYSLIKKFNSIFGLKIELDKDALNRLFVISQNRNILVHNKGLINGIYLMELRKYSITTNKKEGEYILSDLSDHTGLKSQWEFIHEIAKNISLTLEKDFKRINEYHKNIKRK